MRRTMGLLAVLAIGQSAAWAGDSHAGHAVAAKAGLLGLGLEYNYTVSDRLGVRLGWNGSKLGFDSEESGIEYEFDLMWDSLSAAVDFHPLASPFRVTGGLLRNKNRLEALSRPTAPVTVGNRTYTPEEVGTLDLHVGFSKSAPFVGVGWDWSRRSRLVGVSFDMGVLRQGSPRVSLAGSGTLMGDPMFEADIAAEEADLREDLRSFKYFPFASVGLVFRF